MTRADEELVGRGYAAFGTGDVAALTEVLSPAVVWRVPGDSLIAGVYEGRDAVFGFFGRLGELSGGTHRVELRSVRSEGADTVVAENSVSADRDGAHYASTETIVFTVADGRLVDADVTPADQAAFDAFWS